MMYLDVDYLKVLKKIRFIIHRIKSELGTNILWQTAC